MVAALLSTVPVALGLFLIVFGVPGRPFLAPTRRNLLLVATLAVVLGPVALLVLGFVGWLLLIGVLVLSTVLGAAFGPPRRRALQE